MTEVAHDGRCFRTMGQISVQQKSHSTRLFKLICFWCFLMQCFILGRFAYYPFLLDQILNIFSDCLCYSYYFLVDFSGISVTILHRCIILLRHHLNFYCIHPVGKLIWTYTAQIYKWHTMTQWSMFWVSGSNFCPALSCLFIDTFKSS